MLCNAMTALITPKATSGGDLPVIFTIHGDEHTDGTVNGGGGKDYNESEGGTENPVTDFPG